MADEFLVRMHPYNPPAGYVKRTHTIESKIFREGGRWVKVPSHIADNLRLLRSDMGTPRSPFAFEVCTLAEAQEVHARELAEAEAAKKPDTAVAFEEMIPGNPSGTITTKALEDGKGFTPPGKTKRRGRKQGS